MFRNRNNIFRSFRAFNVVGNFSYNLISKKKVVIFPKVTTSRPQSFNFSSQITALKFEEISNDTIESLCDYFEEILEKSPYLENSDVILSDGVLTVYFGEPFGIYVINRQTPNKQLWLSSPISGPKRYDYVKERDGWIYSHDNCSLHNLLQNEISQIIEEPLDFMRCKHSGNGTLT